MRFFFLCIKYYLVYEQTLYIITIEPATSGRGCHCSQGWDPDQKLLRQEDQCRGESSVPKPPIVDSLLQVGSLVAQFAAKTNRALKDLDVNDGLVSIWMKSGIKEARLYEVTHCLQSISNVKHHFQMMIFSEDEYLLTVEKKVEQEKFEHPECIYCEQNRDGTFGKC